MPREQIHEDQYDIGHGENIDASVEEPETTIVLFKCVKCDVKKKMTEKDVHDLDVPEHHGKPMKRVRKFEK